jgi:hypothetical protein
MKKLFLLALLFAMSASAQTLPQPNTKGNAPTVVCITMQTATVAQFKGAPVASPVPACFSLSDGDFLRLLTAFGATCASAPSLIGQPPPPACTTDQIGATATSFLRDRLFDFISGYDRQQAVTNIQPPTAAPAN